MINFENRIDLNLRTFKNESSVNNVLFLTVVTKSKETFLLLFFNANLISLIFYALSDFVFFKKCVDYF